jgi:hypothetical protein
MPATTHDISNRVNAYPCFENIPTYRLATWKVVNSKVGLKLCQPTDVPCALSGAIEKDLTNKFENHPDMTFYNIRETARWKVCFSTDATAGDPVYVGENGTVTKTPVDGAYRLGIAADNIPTPPTVSEGAKPAYYMGFVLQDAESYTKYAEPETPQTDPS